MPQRLRIGFLVIGGLILLGGCVQPAVERLPTVGPPSAVTTVGITAAPSRTPSATAETLTDTSAYPPVVLHYSPQSGEEVSTDTPLTWRFDRPMDRESLVNGLRLSPQVEGEYTWSEEDRVATLIPERLAQGTRYHVIVERSVQSVDGHSLSTELAYGFTTLSPLAITQVTPRDGTDDLRLDTPIVVAFNRPVVPAACEGREAVSTGDCPPLPLTASPAVSGRGLWVSSSIYRLEPAGGLAAGVRYDFAIGPELVSMEGATLAHPFAWTFQTAAPQLLGSTPAHWETGVLPDSSIRVRFNTPMDRAATGSAFGLVAENGAPVGGVISWADRGAVLVFTPTEQLDLGSTYIAQVGARARAATSAPLTNPSAWSFETVPLPALTSSVPSDGAERVDVGQPVLLGFVGAIDVATLLEGASISPTVHTSDLFTHYVAETGVYAMAWDQSPRTRYCISMGPEIIDLYGNHLDVDEPFCFVTGDLPPALDLASGGETATLDAIGAPELAFYVRNVDRATFTLTESDVSAALSREVAGGRVLREWSETFDIAPNVTNIVTVSLSRTGGPLLPGLYSLSWNEAGGEGAAGMATVVVTDRHTLVKLASGEALVWVTDLRTGAPVTRTTVELVDEDSLLLAGGTTDLDGIARLLVPGLEDLERAAAVLVDELGAPGFGMVTLACGGALGECDGPADVGPGEPYRLFLETDRDLYRAGEPLLYTGVLRKHDEMGYHPPEQGTWLTLTLRDATMRPVFTKTAEASSTGLLHGAIPLPATTPAGNYVLELTVPPPWDTYPRQLARRDIRILPYGGLEFEITVTADVSEVVRGDTVGLRAHAVSPGGLGVGDAVIEWVVRSSPSRSALLLTESGPGEVGSNEWYTVTAGQAVTDSDGRYTIEVPTSSLSSAYSAGASGAERWMVTVVVTDRSGASATALVTVVVHPSDVYLTLSPRSRVVGTRDRALVEVLATDLNGNPVAQREIVLRYVRRVSSHAEAGTSRFSDEPVGEQTVTTGTDGVGSGGFTVPGSGVYVVTAETQDAQGRPSRAEAIVWASGDESQMWADQPGTALAVIPDSDLYQVGDVARILIATPFDGPFEVLLTVERGTLLSVARYTFDDPNPVLEVPIAASYAPNVYVSCVVVRPSGDDSMPEARLGYAHLAVDPGDRKLRVTIMSDKPVYEPGETATFTLTTTDLNGQPVPAALGFSLVDRTLVSPGFEPTESPLDAFYGDQALRVLTNDSLLVSGDRVEARPSLETWGIPALSTAGSHARSEALHVPVGGEVASRPWAGGPATAFWAPEIQTDELGQAVVSVLIPRALAVWRARAWAVTGDTRVGYAEVSVPATKPLYVQSQAPGHLVEGDMAELAAVVHNNTAEDLVVDAWLEVLEGLEPSTLLQRQFSLSAGERRRLVWPVTVEATGGSVAEFRYGVRSGSYEDLAYPSAAPIGGLPIIRHIRPEGISVSGSLDVASTRLAAIHVPSQIDDASELAVYVLPSLASSLQAVLLQSGEPPVLGTVDGWASHLLAIAVSFDALSQAGIGGDNLDEIRVEVEGTLQQIYALQNPDGGWGWVRDQSGAFFTSYVVYALLRCDEMGISVRHSVLDLGLSYLEASLGEAVSGDTHRSHVAFGLYTLSLAKREWPQGAASTLYAQRDSLGIAGRAYLALALGEVDASDTRVAALLDDLRAMAVTTSAGIHWEEIDSGALLTDAYATAVVVDAMVHLVPGDAILGHAIAWLLTTEGVTPQTGAFHSAWVITSLADYLAVYPDAGVGSYGWSVSLNGMPILASTDQAAGAVLSRGIHSSALGDSASSLQRGINVLAFSRGAGIGTFYYAALLRPSVTAAEITEAVSRGIGIKRNYCQPTTGGLAAISPMDPYACAPVDPVRVGDRIEVRLSLTVPTTRHYVSIEDVYPAGFQPVVTGQAVIRTLGGDPDVALESVRFGPDRARFLVRLMPAGTYEIVYEARAATPGCYLALPARGQLVYFPEVWGATTVDRIEVQSIGQ